MSSLLEGDQVRCLLDAGRALVAERDVEAVLERILEAACEITGASYAALGVLNESRTELQRFLTRGIDPETYRAIGDLPHGRGVLGVLIEDPRPLRLADVTRHPHSYGFPAQHPPMHTFLGVPLVIRGAPWGNLYLTEKQGGAQFNAHDEEAVVVLAQWAAVAIDNARLYESSERRRQRLEGAVHSLQAARDITDAISGEANLERILELIVKRGRALVDARAVVILLREGDDLVVAASAGHVHDAEGRRIAISESTSGQVLERDRPERITDARGRLRVAPSELGIPDARCALLAPMRHRGEGVGVLAAFDRGPEHEPFTAEDEQTLRSFAAAAGNAVAINRSIKAERLHSALAAAETERGRWARELHDQTLQSLGGLRVALSTALRRGDAAHKDRAIREAIDDIESEIDNLRGIISDLRPSALDDLGLSAAVEALLDRRRDDGLEITAELALPAGRFDGPRGRGLETTVYRVIQEALTNVVKHARADAARVSISMADGEVRIEVEDNGAGFDSGKSTTGFGLTGIRERVSLAGGTVDVASTGNGTLVRARLPARVAEGSAAP
jgi:signal transduction histidine kinase